MKIYPQNVIDRLRIIDGQGMPLSEQQEDIGWSEWHIRQARKKLGLNFHRITTQNKIECIKLIKEGNI